MGGNSLTKNRNAVDKKLSFRKKLALRENFSFLLLALPGIILLFIFNYLPMFGVIVAFKQFNPNLGILKSKWVGLSNFEFFFTSQDALRVTGNTLFFSITFMITGTIAAVTVALFLYNLRNNLAIKIYNTIMILPRFLSMVLISFIVYALLNPSAGLLNQVIGFFGGKDDIDWYAWPAAWRYILTTVNLWQNVGMNSIIFYAALMGIDEALFEAAKLDGANKWKQTIHIAIPCLIPILTITTILSFGNLFNGDFGLFYQTTRDVGTLYPTTDIINTYVFRGLMGGNIDIAASVGLFQSLVGLILVLLANLVVKKISPENSLL